MFVMETSLEFVNGLGGPGQGTGRGARQRVAGEPAMDFSNYFGSVNRLALRARNVPLCHTNNLL